MKRKALKYAKDLYEMEFYRPSGEDSDSEPELEPQAQIPVAQPTTGRVVLSNDMKKGLSIDAAGFLGSLGGKMNVRVTQKSQLRVSGRGM